MMHSGKLQTTSWTQIQFFREFVTATKGERQNTQYVGYNDAQQDHASNHTATVCAYEQLKH